MDKIENKLQYLVNQANILELGVENISIAQEFLENREYELCFDTIAEQLYGSNINIFHLMKDLILQMKLPKDKYSYIGDVCNLVPLRNFYYRRRISIRFKAWIYEIRRPFL